MPYFDSDRGLISTRTAGSALPLTFDAADAGQLRKALRD